MKQIQTSQREKILIIATSVVLFVVVSFFLWKPLFLSWRNTSLLYDSKKLELANVRKTLAQEPEYRQKYKELSDRLKNPGGPTPVPDVLPKLEQFGRDAGVNFRSRTPQPPRDRGGFTEVAVECSMDASIDSLVQFLYQVKTAQELIDVTELKITPTPANASILRADARLVSLSAVAR